MLVTPDHLGEILTSRVIRSLMFATRSDKGVKMTATTTKVPAQPTPGGEASSGPTVPAQRAPDGAPHFCSQCGNPLNGPFCSGCGASSTSEQGEQLRSQPATKRTDRAVDVLAARVGGNNRLLIVGAIATLCVAGAGVSAALLTGGASSVTLHGTMMINPASDSEFGDNFSTAGSTCSGSGGYDDLTQGASVTIHDPTGKVIATGALEEGHGVDGVGCLFNWRIPKAPKEKFYGVEISHRGTVNFKTAEIKGGFDTDIGD